MDCWIRDWDELDESGADALFKTWKEGGSVSRVSGLYTVHSKEAVQLEKALEKIDDGLKSQSECMVPGRTSVGMAGWFRIYFPGGAHVQGAGKAARTGGSL